MPPSRKRQKLSEAEQQSNAPVPNDVEDSVEKSSADAHNQSRTLFIRSLPPSTTTDQLAEFFSQTALLKHATAVLDKNTGECKGYGFVTFAELEDARRARNATDGQDFAGRAIHVEYAEARTREAPLNGHEKKPTVYKKREKSLREQPESNNESLPAPRLIVRNLPWSIKEPEQLAQLFLSYGKVKETKLPKQPDGKLRGFGFVLLRGRKNAEKAINGLNGRDLDGRTIAVDWSAPKDAWEQMNTAPLKSKIKSSLSTDSPQHESILNNVNGDFNEEEESGQTDDSDSGDEYPPSVDDASSEIDSASDGEDKSNTIFIRNIPFTIDDDALYAHFRSFGPLRYARIVMDYTVSEEGRSKGTGFVCFHQLDDAQKCLKGAPKSGTSSSNDGARGSLKHSLLEDTQCDPSGQYTMEGRLLQISQGLNREQAQKVEAESKAKRNKADKRRLYLLKEGNVSPNSPLFALMTPTEVRMREASEKQRQEIVRKNPSLHMSLTRLAVRNLPRFVDSKGLKALARQAVVGFATDVKEGKRQPLNKEELSRTTEAMKEAERKRRSKGKGIVKQAKIIFESREGSKITEKSAAARSRGYGFIEYMSHRCALMGLRWLNGHLVKHTIDEKSASDTGIDVRDSAKRLIVEFAIENAQVVQRRRDREQGLRNYNSEQHDSIVKLTSSSQNQAGTKRRRHSDEDPEDTTQNIQALKTDVRKSVRQRIIGRKRAKRRARRT